MSVVPSHLGITRSTRRRRKGTVPFLYQSPGLQSVTGHDDTEALGFQSPSDHSPKSGFVIHHENDRFHRADILRTGRMSGKVAHTRVRVTLLLRRRSQSNGMTAGSMSSQWRIQGEASVFDVDLGPEEYRFNCTSLPETRSTCRAPGAGGHRTHPGQSRAAHNCPGRSRRSGS